MRQLIYFDDDVFNRLRSYTRKKYGNKRAISAVVQNAVVIMLNQEDNKNAKTKSKQASKSCKE